MCVIFPSPSPFASLRALSSAYALQLVCFNLSADVDMLPRLGLSTFSLHVALGHPINSLPLGKPQRDLRVPPPIAAPCINELDQAAGHVLGYLLAVLCDTHGLEFVQLILEVVHVLETDANSVKPLYIKVRTSPPVKAPHPLGTGLVRCRAHESGLKRQVAECLSSASDPRSTG
jgi:hypothetical protein